MDRYISINVGGSFYQNKTQRVVPDLYIHSTITNNFIIINIEYYFDITSKANFNFKICNNIVIL